MGLTAGLFYSPRINLFELVKVFCADSVFS